MITFEEIRADRHSLKEVEGIEGIYKVYLPEDIPFQLNKTTTAFEYDKNGRKLVYDTDEDIERLLHQWELIQSAKEPDNRLVYIGKAVKAICILWSGKRRQSSRWKDFVAIN